MKSIPLTENEINHIKETYSLELEKLQKRTNEISEILKKLRGKSSEDNQLVVENSPKKQSKEVQKPVKKGSPKKEISKKAENKISIAEEKPKAKRGRPAKIKPAIKAEAVPATKAPATVVQKGKRGRKPAVKVAIANKETKSPKVAKAKKEIKKAKPAKALKVKKTAVKALQTKKDASKSATPAKRGRKKSEGSKKSKWTASIIEILENKGKVQPSRDIIEQIMKIHNIPASDQRKIRSTITGSLSDLKLETKKIKSISIPGQKGELYGLSQWFDEKGKLLDSSKL